MLSLSFANVSNKKLHLKSNLDGHECGTKNVIDGDCIEKCVIFIESNISFMIFRILTHKLYIKMR